ncbi:DUF5518 domain-containing protein [Halalkalicoccus jeotgali]|uniref:DUF5518 domain-containing protein n=1 Tax=Halalkalicoccus jeotgali (strain DSM 18796 / CECT 7217 / JCM 14584 / KCTC 4019 / B3) TaxID=795797 RepID=D8J6D0_HALJB|nr:DUF5518 domain-containing protein [Halalkalicoccus jeotgali]ADJ15848.1 hypothetical protein HacjB3_12325 [Halalkalicoccus jeotgali B3]ELY37944.1 hypothetical protein C497_07519 [Halalkalicoccus jeotgali B3]
MEISWKAVLIGFAVTMALGLISGLIYVGSDATIVVLYWGTVGVLGGLAAGYVVGGTSGSGAFHGGLATVFGSVVVLVSAAFTTLLFGGIVPTFGVLVFGALVLAFYAIPGMLGGAVGSWVKGRRAAPETRRTRA